MRNLYICPPLQFHHTILHMHFYTYIYFRFMHHYTSAIYNTPLTCFLKRSAWTPKQGSADSMNCITSSMPHSCVGVLLRAATGDSDNGASAGVVEVAASCSGGGFRFVGGGRMSQLGHSLRPDSRPEIK